MQDRFKFRLFDKAISQMSYNVCIGFIKDGIKRDWVCADLTYGQMTYTGDRLKDIELMQCTGLKDKNGKLICEHDIVKCQKWDLAPTDMPEIGDKLEEEVGIVEWDKRNARFLVVREVGAEHPFQILLSEGSCVLRDAEVEVIGNIYENPELVNDK